MLCPEQRKLYISIIVISCVQILSWFADIPKLLCPFSLHAMMEQAQASGHSPGDWFGPSQVAVMIR